MTYAPFYRPVTNKDGFGLLGKAGWRWVEMFLLSRGAVGVRLDASNDALVERLHARGDDHVKSERDLRQIADMYRYQVRHSPSTRFTVDTTEQWPTQADVDRIWFKALQEEDRSAQVLSLTPEYVGSLTPDVLLVGDERNVTKTYGNETSLPFMPVDNSSGIYLLEAIPNDLWQRVGMVNGNDMTGDLMELWEALGRPRPVALGNRAKDALLGAGFTPLQFNSITHPAYARRFEHSNKEQYGKSIGEAELLKGHS